MRHLIGFAFVLSVLGGLAGSAHAQTTYTEPPDLSNTIPGPEIALGVGTNTISGAVATPTDSQDNFQVTVPTGAEITAISLTLDTSDGFSGFVTWNLSETRMSSGAFTSGLPAGPGTYQLQVVANFSVGNSWSLSFTVAGAEPECGNGLEESGEACDDGNTTECDGCSSSCEVVLDGCLIEGSCVADGAADPDNECRACDPAISTTAYSPVAEDTPCDDGLYCTDGDVCDGSGGCAGAMPTCVDGDPCTTDECNEAASECTFDPIDGCGADAGMPDGGLPDAGPADAGSDGGSDDAGVQSDAALGDAGGAGGGGSSDGCGCHVAGRSTGSHAPLALAAAGLLGLALRRRRRR